MPLLMMLSLLSTRMMKDSGVEYDDDDNDSHNDDDGDHDPDVDNDDDNDWC